MSNFNYNAKQKIEFLLFLISNKKINILVYEQKEAKFQRSKIKLREKIFNFLNYLIIAN